VLASSKEFLEQNDLVLQFVESYIQKSQDQDGWFTLAEAKEALKNSEYNNNKPGSLKNALVRSLNTSCLPAADGQQKYTNVFLGFKIVAPSKLVHDQNGLDKKISRCL
jgi:hypothetical protein